MFVIMCVFGGVSVVRLGESSFSYSIGIRADGRRVSSVFVDRFGTDRSDDTGGVSDPAVPVTAPEVSAGGVSVHVGMARSVGSASDLAPVMSARVGIISDS
jgi:hypothetical protein